MMQVSERIDDMHIQIEMISIAFAYDNNEKTTPPIECYYSMMTTILQWWQGAVEAISSALAGVGNVGRLPLEWCVIDGY